MYKATLLLFSAAMMLMALSPTATTMIVAQAIAGIAVAAMVPTLVMLIAAHYQDSQQVQALAWLGAAEAMGGVLAFLLAGFLGTWIGWRYSFGLLTALATAVFVLSKRLNLVAGESGLQIDGIGVGLSALTIVLVSLGFDNANRWGLFLATRAAPFELLGVSPAPVMIVAGIISGQAFFLWLRKRRAANKPPASRSR